MKRNYIIIVVIILIIFFFPLRRALVISTDGTIEKISFIEEDERFSVRWIHSVEDEEWEEFFIIKHNSIVLEATRFKTFGAGVPNDVGRDSYIKDGWLYMVGIDRVIEDMVIRTNKSTNHRFFYKDQVFLLSQEKGSKAYKIEWKFIHLYQLLSVH